jgi:DNA-directed DNA polymerase III PolC
MFLNCHTWYSLKFGVMPPSELVAYAQRAGVKALALTDINNTSCTMEFIAECQAKGIKPVVGIEFREKGKLQFIGLAKSAKGFSELNEFLTNCSFNETTIPDTAPEFKDCYVIYPFDRQRNYQLRENEYIGVRQGEVRRLVGSPLAKQREKLVALNPVTVRNKTDHTIHTLLQAIDQNTILSKIDTSVLALDNERFYYDSSLQVFYDLFPELLENAEKLLADCSIEVDLKASKNKKFFTVSEQDDRALLHKLAKEGFHYRYGPNDKKALERFTEELAVIYKMGFASYFLITHDIIQYARSRGYHHIGRGSGANSIVAYCLKITDVDPIELNLFFERFINEHRVSPPDFDIDFSWAERDEITDYIFKRYGSRHVALLATYTTFRDRSIIRELGKVYGLPKEAIDTLIKEPNATHKHHPLAEEILKYGELIQDFPNHLSIHAGGVLISEEPLTNYTALKLMPKGFPIVHFDMHVAEDIGYHKYDILSQRGLGHIRDTVEIVAKNRGVVIDIHQARKFMKDPNLNAMLREGKTIGCFYIESPAMRQLLYKLKCDNYPCLVAASSIIRPGVAESGMMDAYIDFHNNPHKVKYLHPTFADMLGETYGVMVYQEDVMKIAHYFGGLTLEEADVLRRAMSGKTRGGKGFQSLRDKFFGNCRAKGYPEELIAEVWRQMESFSGYSFCKAHSASYAVESYQSLYLKAYYPLEFMVGVINNFGGFYSTELYIHEARLAGGDIQAPCVNNSSYLTSIKGNVIHLGFVHIKGLEAETGQAIEQERRRHGEFTSLEDFMKRIPIKREQLNLLIRINAFRFTGQTRQALSWEKNNFLNPEARNNEPSLFAEEAITEALPELEVHPLEDAFEQKALLGFPLVSPFDMLETSFRAEATYDEFPQHAGKMVKLAAYFVTDKTIVTKHGDLMKLCTWIDHKGNYFDTAHFPDSLQQWPIYGSGLYLLRGKVTESFGYYSLDVRQAAPLPVIKFKLTNR